MKIIVISDTHGKHRKLNMPKGDMLIHAGDVSMEGKTEEVIDFLNWFGELQYKYKIMIAGNHDYFFEKINKQELDTIIPQSVIYLNDSGVTIEGINIWGSPVTLWYENWAFNRHPGKDISKHWELIPKNTNLLITHSPVFGILDKLEMGLQIGCPNLLKKVNEVIPRLHIFGHVHEAYGVIESKDTTFINASSLNSKYELQNKPIEFIW